MGLVLRGKNQHRAVNTKSKIIISGNKKNQDKLNIMINYLIMNIYQ